MKTSRISSNHRILDISFFQIRFSGMVFITIILNIRKIRVSVLKNTGHLFNIK